MKTKRTNDFIMGFCFFFYILKYFKHTRLRFRVCHHIGEPQNNEKSEPNDTKKKKKRKQKL